MIITIIAHELYLGTRTKPVIGLYVGPGVWRDGIEALKIFFENNGIDYRELTPSDIIKDDLEDIKVLVIPGGWAWDYHLSLKSCGEDVIRHYVSRGGSVIGICASAYYLSRTLVWEGKIYTYSLGLLDVVAIGHRDDFPWPTYGYVNITLSEKFPLINIRCVKAFYYGGPTFTSIGRDIKILARYSDTNEAAIVMDKYGEGIVILVGAVSYTHLTLPTN